MKPIRISEISYTNVWPIHYYFETAGLSVELIPQVPSQLNQGMAKGEIDLGAISSFAYGAAYPNYVILPNLSVSVRGPVGSIFLFTKGQELHELEGAKIALTNTSWTSVNLLRVILERFEKITPNYITMSPNLEQMMEQADAALMIGDDAIRGSWHNPGYRVYDLGLEWFKRTGLSMTFAVWAVRKEILETRSPELERIYQRFIEAKEKSKRNLTPVIDKAIRKVGGDKEFWQHYFDGLIHDFGKSEIQGLQAYFQYVTELGILKKEIHICTLDSLAKLST
ncbi:menaquinone biosynthetic enzyme MqnA/MqnD family protein [Thermoflavimicrobium daqui]|jgi:chorismate dehydratase|uniref:Chorismate dehydratase n=1 Tax=Thermoflavimicrobium daqui TaxID=2137476 RepID=A0A364K2I5_9BACL|nr:menaquinone biosynthesis protein [Thermoflavimicrobium daqui]RAL22632.1 ABC transporter substrate-binding protein [Thermoflavimicrobium daqui]